MMSQEMLGRMSARDMAMMGLRLSGLDDTTTGDETQDGGGVSGDEGTEPRG